jgi:hypothetical protein
LVITAILLIFSERYPSQHNFIRSKKVYVRVKKEKGVRSGLSATMAGAKAKERQKKTRGMDW